MAPASPEQAQLELALNSSFKDGYNDNIDCDEYKKTEGMMGGTGAEGRYKGDRKNQKKPTVGV